MSVDATNSLYDNSIKSTEFMRDVIAGDDAIKSKKTTYVPALSGQDDIEYEAMLNRPVFEGYTSRTQDGLSGLIFAKKPLHEVHTSLEPLLENINLENKTLTDLAQDVVDEVLSVGRVGLLVDIASVDTNGMTVAEVEALNIRPYTKLYNTESIINWKHKTINNRKVLSMVVLREEKETYADEFTSEIETIYRVLSLQDGIYLVRIFENLNSDNAEYTVTEEYYPKMQGKYLTEIPFIGITPTSLTLIPEKPPLYDLAKVNLTHFKTNVDYYHGMHFTALPTPYGSGVQMGENESIGIGSTSFHMFPDPDATLEYLEFKGDGLGTLEREKSSLKESMVILGSNMLQGDKNMAEAENTVAMRNAGQNATLISTANTVSRGIKKALEIMSKWNGTEFDIVYKLNTDYNLTTLNPQELAALVSAWQMGAFSQRDLFTNLKKGELIEETKTFEEYQNEIQEEAPAIVDNPIKATNTTQDKTTQDKTTLQSIIDKMSM